MFKDSLHQKSQIYDDTVNLVFFLSYVLVCKLISLNSVLRTSICPLLLKSELMEPEPSTFSQAAVGGGD